MRLQAAIQGDLKALLKSELGAAERAVTAGVREATDGLKTELRGQITGAGLGSRLANTWRGEVYPKGQPSIGRRQGAAFARLSGRTTVPVFILAPQVTVKKRLDVDGAARKWIAALPQLVLRAWRR